MKISSVTQRMVNEYPGWSSVRVDEQSLGYQFANVMGNRIQELDEEVFRAGNNYFLTTANLSEIDVVYTHELGPSFVFTANTADQTHPVYTPPTVTGTITGSWYGSGTSPVSSPVSVTQAAKNDIKTFWYTSLPKRVRSTSNTTATNVVLAPTAISSCPITTGLSQPFTPTKLWITMSGGALYIKNKKGDLERATVTISGITRKGTEEDETMVFLFNDTKQTQKEWKSITAVRVFGVDPSTATIGITAVRFNNGPHTDAYNLFHGVSGNKVDTFWGKSDDNLALEFVRYSTEDPRNLLLGNTTKHALRAFELQKVDATSAGITDLAVQPFSNLIWVLDGNYIRIYNTDLPYPNMKAADKKVYDSEVRLEPDSYYKRINEDVEMTFRVARPIREISRHRVTYKRPDNTTVVGSWIDGTINDGRLLKPSELFTLNQNGEWLFTLDVEYADGTTTCDQRVITVDVKKALAEFYVAAIASPNTPSGIGFDSDQNLWLIDNTGKKYLLEFAYDVMLVDYDQKVIYFRENYPVVTAVP